MITLQYAVATCLMGFLVAYLFTPVVKRLAIAAGMLDIPNERKIHRTPVPRGGGIAVFLGFHIALAAFYLLPWSPLKGYLSIAWWERFMPISIALLALGLADDLGNLAARTKLGGQIAVALAAFASGMHVGGLLGIKLPIVPDVALTVFWFVAIINAFNLIDGMDGLATGLAVIAGIGLAGTLFLQHLGRDVAVVFALVGACLGFLRYNFHPAKIFLGDSGSTFLGFTLGAIALSTGAKDTAVTTLVVPLLAVGIPLFDTGLAVWRRSARRLSGNNGGDVMTSDREHLHHRLLDAGIPHRRAAIVLYAMGLALVLVGLLSMIHESHALGIYLLAFMAATYVIVRHLAHVELWDSGNAILNGLQRPTHKVMAVLLYPPLDAFLLIAAYSLTCLLAERGTLAQAFVDGCRSRMPLWVGLPFLFIWLARAYVRAWSRARVTDYLGLSVALITGIVVTAGVSHLIFEGSRRLLILEAACYAGLAVPAIVGLRLFFRAVQDVMPFLHQCHAQRRRNARHILVYGDGDGCVLFLRDLTMRLTTGRTTDCVAGILSGDSNLNGRFVHGHLVLGTLAAADDAIHRHSVCEIVATVPLSEAEELELGSIARRHGIEVSAWQTSRQRLFPPA